MTGDAQRRITRIMDINCFRLSSQNLNNLNNNVMCTKWHHSYNRAVKKTKHKQYVVKTPQTSRDLREFKQKGIVFIWPQRRRIYCSRIKEFTFLAWFLAHSLFWLHVINLLPCGAGLALTQPPWKYKLPLRKPENRDYIIEPDWDSCYL